MGAGYGGWVRGLGTGAGYGGWVLGHPAGCRGTRAGWVRGGREGVREGGRPWPSPRRAGGGPRGCRPRAPPPPRTLRFKPSRQMRETDRERQRERESERERENLGRERYPHVAAPLHSQAGQRHIHHPQAVVRAQQIRVHARHLRQARSPSLLLITSLPLISLVTTWVPGVPVSGCQGCQ